MSRSLITSFQIKEFEDRKVAVAKINGHSTIAEVRDCKLIRWTCTCPWGSIGRFKPGYENTHCKHIKALVELLAFVGILKYA